MQSDPILLVIALLAVLWALAVTARSRAAHRRYREFASRHSAPALATPAQEERGEHMSAVDARLVELEQRLRRLGEQQKKPAVRDTMHPHYEPAIRLARKGADVDELVATCGLARGEAELIALMHHRKDTSAATARDAT
ncbi:MAG: DUF2802 domain-containing protein [Gammaproteobacteria bacterium]